MMPRPLVPAATAALLLLGGCTPTDPTARADAEAARVPAATAIGEPQSCISRSQVRATVVRSDSVIDFEMRGGAVYRNTLTSRCPGLGMERAITFNTSIDQLCSPQVVYVLQNIAGVPQQGAGCSLGRFVPVEYTKDEAR